MPRKLKKQIEIRIIADSREKRLEFLQDIKFDKCYGADKIKILDYKIECCKPKNCRTSTGDLTILYRFDGETNWKKTSFCIELKKGSDLQSTLFSSYKRFNQELNRCDKYNLDFYILTDWDFNDVKNHFIKLKNMKKISYKLQPYYIFLDRYIEVCRKYPIIQVKNDLSLVIRRLIKKYIKENKLQYEE